MMNILSDILHGDCRYVTERKEEEEKKTQRNVMCVSIIQKSICIPNTLARVGRWKHGIILTSHIYKRMYRIYTTT